VKEMRAKAEAELITGVSMKEAPEVKANPIAHKEFQRVRRLLKAISKDDDLTGGIINTYCLLHAECKEFENIKQQLSDELTTLQAKYQDKEIDFTVYVEQADKIRSALFACDKKVMDKRKMMLDVAKENIMTIQSALRTIPKKIEKNEDSPMAKFMARRQANDGR
jgi:uncharacterized coiled-coil DUF342 family protein